ncbi:MAG: ABC transporter ATP-binding protein, partial [Alphaproteobacteria bacterium]
PTNHLDVMSREALVQAINDFNGAVVIVSHDPHVIELTADRLWLVDGGGVAPFDGDMDAYRALLLERRRANGGNGRTKGEAEDSGDRKQRRRAAATQRQALAPLRKRLARAEKSVSRLETEKTALAKRMADPALYDADKSALIALQKELGGVDKALEAAEQDWLDAQAALEAADNGTATENG